MDYVVATQNAVVEGGKIQLNILATKKGKAGDTGLYSKCSVASGLKPTGMKVNCNWIDDDTMELSGFKTSESSVTVVVRA